MNYWEGLTWVLDDGFKVDSRAGETREVLNLSIDVPVFQLPRRVKMARQLGYMELMQFLCGTYEPLLIGRVAPRVDLSLFGRSAIYGPRVMHLRDQLDDAIKELKANPGSRRALVTVTSPGDPMEDQPCISSIQFFIRGGDLMAIVTARSWDLWFGAPHDLIVLSGLLQVVGGCLDMDMQNAFLSVNAGSAHVYERAVEGIQVSGGSWNFQLPRLNNLAEYRGMAQSMKNDPTWRGGLPNSVDGVAIVEDFPLASIAAYHDAQAHEYPLSTQPADPDSKIIDFPGRG